MLFSIILFSQSPTPKEATKTHQKIKKERNILWISKQINTYGQASNLFHLGKLGSYWNYSKIDVKADSVQIAANYTYRSNDTLPKHPAIIRFDDIIDLSLDDFYPKINLTDNSLCFG